jgi:hypothetical protein
MPARTYAVTFQGAASTTLRAAFDDYELEAANGATVVRCRDDQLHSVLHRLQDLGLELVEVRSETP